MMPRLWFIILICIAVYGIVLCVFYVTQAHFIYFPKKDIIAEPKHIGLPFEDVVFPAADRHLLSGWYVPAVASRGCVLFCHGNAGNISNCLDTVLTFNHFGLDVFIFDYRGYGKSEGIPDEKGTYADARGAWEYLVQERKIPSGSIIICGRSLGGPIAAWLAQETHPAGLVVESAFTSIPDIGAQLYPFLPVRLLSRYTYATRDHVQAIHCPLLVVHSRDDEMIPFRHGQNIFDAAQGHKEFLEIRGSHNEGYAESAVAYERGMKRFIRTCLGEKNEK